MEFKNSIYLPPMAKESSIDGIPSDQLIDYYDQMASKGFGLIIMEHAYVNKYGKASPRQMAIDEDFSFDILSKICQRIKSHDSKAFMQISHGGRFARGSDRRFGPSPEDGVQALSLDDIKKLEDDFLQAALRVKYLGYDGVQIHSAHGYLLNQFYSPLVNKRDDQYGGPLENRIRLHLEILEKIREKLPDFHLSLRLGACDYLNGGNTVDDAIKASQLMEPYLDSIDISGGIQGFLTYDESGRPYFAEEARAIKENTDLMVLTCGGIKDRAEALDLVNNGFCTMAGIGRAALKKDFHL